MADVRDWLAGSFPLAVPPDKRERRPESGAWVRTNDRAPRGRGYLASSTWECGRLLVISCLEMADAPDGNGVIPQWHVSMSRHGRRAKDHECKRVLRDFDLVGAEEDNHHPGVARNFWMPVDPSRRVDCECKAGETTVTEADGYKWQNETDPAKCRGCEHARTFGVPCTIHGVISHAK